MFGFIESLAKATVSAVVTPVAVVADVVTLGGAMSDQDKPYTAQALEGVVENLQNAVDPKKF